MLFLYSDYTPLKSFSNLFNFQFLAAVLLSMRAHCYLSFLLVFSLKKLDTYHVSNYRARPFDKLQPTILLIQADSYRGIA